MEINNDALSVKKGISPIVYISIAITGILIIAIAAIIAVSVLNKPSYKNAEIKYFSSAANVINDVKDEVRAAEMSLTFKPVIDGYEEINPTTIDIKASTHECGFSSIISYLNGEKEVLSANLWGNVDRLNFFIEKLSDAIYTGKLNTDEETEDEVKLDLELLHKNLSDIFSKYLELAGDPEIVAKNIDVNGGDLVVSCSQYKIVMNSEFLSELLVYAADVLLENENLMEAFSYLEARELIENFKEGASDPDYIDTTITMDVYVNGNAICKRVISIKELEVSITDLNNKNQGYTSIKISDAENTLLFVNECEKKNDAYTGEMYVSHNGESSIFPRMFTLKYYDLKSIKNAMSGRINLFINQESLEINIAFESKDGETAFSGNALVASTELLTVSGFMKSYDKAIDLEMPDENTHEVIDINNPDSVVDFDIFGFFLDENNLVDNFGNYDIIGMTITQLTKMFSFFNNDYDYDYDYNHISAQQL